MKKEKPRIDGVKVRAIPDENPDTSFLGEYITRAEPWAICRHCGEYVYVAEEADRRKIDIEDELDNDDYLTADDRMRLHDELEALELHECPRSNREYNYFLPYAGGEKRGSEEYQKYGKRDFARMEGLNRGDWSFVGIVAEANVSYPIDNGARRIERFRSDGLWGIESDSGEYLNEVAKDELAGLKEHLETFGVNTQGWRKLTKGVEIEWK